MIMLRTIGIFLAATALAGCGLLEKDEPGLHDDCGGVSNDTPLEATEVEAEDGFEAKDLRLCQSDVDFYAISVDPGTMAYFEIRFDGDETDLMLELSDEAGKEMMGSDSGLGYERVSILTPEKGRGTIGVRWTYEGRVVGEPSKDVVYRGPAATEFHIQNSSGFPPGNYGVEVFLDGQSVGKRDYRVEAEK